MRKIAIITCWFGPLRKDFYFWLKSVGFNSTIDFLIFTDQNIINIPQNCKIKKCDLKYVETLAQKKVWEGCKISYAYKCCDYRPAYGLIFQDYLKDYDFWGHCDTDLIFGDIRHYFPDERLDRYDRLGQNGPLSIYRNTTEVNNIFRNIPYYKEIFSNKENVGFDEWGQGKGTTFYWKDYLQERLDTHMDFDNLQPYHYSFVSCYVEGNHSGVKNLMYCFDNGTLFRYGTKDGNIIKEETLYVHIQKRPLKIACCVADQFNIIPPCKFIKYESNITRQYICWHVRDGKFWAYYTRLRNKLNKLLNKPEWQNTVLLPDQDLW